MELVLDVSNGDGAERSPSARVQELDAESDRREPRGSIVVVIDDTIWSVVDRILERERLDSGLAQIVSLYCDNVRGIWQAKNRGR